jgi:regulator of sigma E protease
MESVMSVLQFVGICLLVLLVFNLLIFVHELGHFLAARWRGLFVEEFALWFGKPLWRKKIGGVWYAINSIPAGGYVKLPQMAPMEAMEGKSDELPAEARRPISAMDKIIVAFAGPLFSFLLACVFAVLVWQIGRPVGEADRTTTVGAVIPGFPADGKLQPGDQILSIDGQKVTRWGGQAEDTVTWRIAGSEEPTLKIEYKRGDTTGLAEITPKIEATKWYQRRGMRAIGLIPKHYPMIAKVQPGSAAATAGFQPNDVLVRVGGEPIYDETTLVLWAKANPGKPLPITVERGQRQADGTVPTVELTFTPPGGRVGSVFADSPASRAGLKEGDHIHSVAGVFTPFSDLVREHIQANDEKPVKLGINRDGKDMELTVIPQVPIEGGGDAPRPSIGIEWASEDSLIFDQWGRRYPIWPTPREQIGEAATAMVQTWKKITSSKSNIGVQHMGGPVMMMRIYYILFEQKDGWKLVLWFSVILNINLAILNMLPLPVLDGGHITLALIEAARRKPVNLRLLEWIQTACALLIIGFMLFVTFFDVQDVFGGRKKPVLRFKPPAESSQPAA